MYDSHELAARQLVLAQHSEQYLLAFQEAIINILKNTFWLSKKQSLFPPHENFDSC